MTTETAPVQESATAAEITRVPLSRLLHVELRKTVDTRAGKWLLIAIAAVTAFVVVLFFFIASEKDLVFDNFLAATGTPQSFVLPVLGILAITSEWSQRTGLVTFTLEPSRTRVVAAKFIAMVVLGLAAVALAFALAAAGNLLAITTQNGVGTWHYPADWVGEVSIGQLIGIIEGLGFGMLFMNSAAAIVCFFVAPLAWTVLFELVDWLHGAQHWVDLNSATSPLFNHEMTGRAWAQLGVAVGIWVVAPLTVGLVRLLRAELKSA